MLLLGTMGLQLVISCLLMVLCNAAQVPPCIPNLNGEVTNVHIHDARFQDPSYDPTSTQNLHVSLQTDYTFVLQFTAHALKCTYNSSPSPGVPEKMLKGCIVNATRDVQELLISDFTVKPNQSCELVFTLMINQNSPPSNLDYCKANVRTRMASGNYVTTAVPIIQKNVNCSVQLNNATAITSTTTLPTAASTASSVSPTSLLSGSTSRPPKPTKPVPATIPTSSRSITVTPVISKTTTTTPTTTSDTAPPKSITCQSYSTCTPRLTTVDIKTNCTMSWPTGCFYVRVSAHTENFEQTSTASKKCLTSKMDSFDLQQTIDDLSPDTPYTIHVEVSPHISFTSLYDQELCNVTTLGLVIATTTVKPIKTITHEPADDTCINQATNSQINAKIKTADFQNGKSSLQSFTFALMSQQFASDFKATPTSEILGQCVSMEEFKNLDFKQGCSVLSRGLKPTTCCVAKLDGSCSNAVTASSGFLGHILLGVASNVNVVYQTCDDTYTHDCIPQLPSGTQIGLAVTGQYGNGSQYGNLVVQKIDISADKASGFTNTDIYIVVGVAAFVLCAIILGVVAQKTKKPIYRERKIAALSDSIPVRRTAVKFDEENISVTHSAPFQMRGQALRGPPSSHSMPAASILKPQPQRGNFNAQRLTSAQFGRPSGPRPPSDVDWIGMATKQF